MNYKEYLRQLLKHADKPLPKLEPQWVTVTINQPEPEEETKALPHPPGTFKPLSLFDKYMFAKSYIRLLKFQLDRSRKQNRVLQDEIVEYKKELAHLKTLFRKDKRLPKN